MWVLIRAAWLRNGIRVFGAMEVELYRNLRPVYPKTPVRNPKGSANGIKLSGVKMDDDKERVMEILQHVWEDDSWMQ